MSNPDLVQSQPSVTLTTNSSVPVALSSTQAMPTTTNKDTTDQQHTKTNQLTTNITTANSNVSSNKTSHSLLAKLADAKKTLFGKTNISTPFFSSVEENNTLLSYILSETQPKLTVIQEFEDNGAQLNAITDEGNTAIHLLAQAQLHSTESINIIDYLIKKGCDPNRQNDYGWTAGLNFLH